MDEIIINNEKIEDDFSLNEEQLTKKLKEENQKNPLDNFQVTNPFTLNMNVNMNDDTERAAYYQKIKEIEKPLGMDVNELIPIFKDILQGDTNALASPEFTTLNLANIKAAIDWLYNNNSLDDRIKGLLANDSWRLAYRAKPPTAEEFLTYGYIGPQAETIFEPVRRHFIESFNPTKPYRTTVLTPCIGWGKAQPIYTEIKTPKGWDKLENLHVGDKVETPSGKEATIIKEWPQGEIDLYEITFEDGRTVECSLEHLWKVSYRRDDKGEKIWDLVETKFMIEHPELTFEIPDTSYYS